MRRRTFAQFSAEQYDTEIENLHFDALLRAFEAHGFRPPCAYYLNDGANTEYARTAPDGGRLSLPALFINGHFDQICTIVGNRQGNPMRAACANLTMVDLPAGHWLPLECKDEHIRASRAWLRTVHLDE